MHGSCCVYLGFVSAAAYSLYGLLLKYHPVSKVAIFGFTNPIFGVILSALFLHEDLSALGWQLYTLHWLLCASASMK
jgi:drug/metabolite transporter (DMT)-like permease